MTEIKLSTDKPLGTTHADRAAALARALAGSVPIAGPFIAELVSAIIPNQRLDRVEAFLVALAHELERLGASSKLMEPSNAPLVEEGIAQAARAFTSERRQFLAKCVAHGIDADERDKLDEMKILRLLDEVGDDDLIILHAVHGPQADAKLAALKPPPLGANAPDRDRAKGELHRASIRKLLAVGFLSSAPYTDEPRRWKYGKSGVLEDGPYISALGRMVLARVGLSPGQG